MHDGPKSNNANWLGWDIEVKRWCLVWGSPYFSVEGLLKYDYNVCTMPMNAMQELWQGSYCYCVNMKNFMKQYTVHGVNLWSNLCSTFDCKKTRVDQSPLQHSILPQTLHITSQNLTSLLPEKPDMLLSGFFLFVLFF